MEDKTMTNDRRGMKKRKKSLVGWTVPGFISISQDFNCDGEHYTKDIYSTRDECLRESHCEKPSKVRITIEEI